MNNKIILIEQSVKLLRYTKTEIKDTVIQLNNPQLSPTALKLYIIHLRALLGKNSALAPLFSQLDPDEVQITSEFIRTTVMPLSLKVLDNQISMLKDNISEIRYGKGITEQDAIRISKLKLYIHLEQAPKDKILAASARMQEPGITEKEYYEQLYIINTTVKKKEYLLSSLGLHKLYSALAEREKGTDYIAAKLGAYNKGMEESELQLQLRYGWEALKKQYPFTITNTGKKLATEFIPIALKPFDDKIANNQHYIDVIKQYRMLMLERAQQMTIYDDEDLQQYDLLLAGSYRPDKSWNNIEDKRQAALAIIDDIDMKIEKMQNDLNAFFSLSTTHM